MRHSATQSWARHPIWRPGCRALPSPVRWSSQIQRATSRVICSSCAIWGRSSIKGITEPTAVFAVTGARSLESRFAARHGEVTAIVGRDQELALLVERWRQAKTGEGQVVLLSGEAGVGKSRITEAVIEAARADPHFLLRYQCSPYHADSALYPAIQQLTHAAGFTEADSVEQRLERLEALLVTSTDRISAVAPLMATLLGIDPHLALRREYTDTAAAAQPHAVCPGGAARRGWPVANRRCG